MQAKGWRNCLFRRRLAMIVAVVMLTLAMMLQGQRRPEEEEQRIRSIPTAPPLIVAAGQGTTGTRSFYYATCLLGMPSVHFFRQCAPENPTKKIKQGIQAHVHLVSAWQDLQRNCIEKRSGSCTFESLSNRLEILKNQTTLVIKSGIHAVHDTPYPYLLHHVLDVAKVECGGVMLMATQRNPSVWATKRIPGYPGTPVCKEFFEFDQPERHEYGALDIFSCYERSLAREDPPPRYIDEVFTTFGRLTKAVDDNKTKYQQLVRFTAIAMEQYQNHIQKLGPVYTINLWKRSVKMDTVDIANEIKHAMDKDKFQLPEQKFVSYFKGEPDGPMEAK